MSTPRPAAEIALGTAGVARRAVGGAESVAANRAWWDADAADYQHEHGAFLGDADFVWCPERLREEYTLPEVHGMSHFC